MAAWEKHQQQVSALQNWDITGRVGLYTNDEAWPGDILWKQKSSQYDMRIIASLGAGNMRVYSVAGGVMLEHSSSPAPYFSSDPASLFKNQFGWTLPVKHLRYWMTGLPSPVVPTEGSLELASSGVISRFQQAGWTIQYQRYKKINGYDLPTKILFEHQDLSIKIVIRKWQI